MVCFYSIATLKNYYILRSVKTMQTYPISATFVDQQSGWPQVVFGKTDIKVLAGFCSLLEVLEINSQVFFFFFLGGVICEWGRVLYFSFSGFIIDVYKCVGFMSIVFISCYFAEFVFEF